MGFRRLPPIVRSARLAGPIQRHETTPAIAECVEPLPVSGHFDVPRLADMMSPEQNSFGVLRLALAIAVVVSHAVYLTAGNVEAEPLFGWTGYTLGQHAVQGFFILSGLLVAQSLSRSASLVAFSAARALRIFPALVACVFASALLLGPFVTTLPAGTYFIDFGVIAYVAKTVSLMSGNASLPGVFADNTIAGVVNSSVWTLKYEVLCYAVLGLVGWAVLRSGWTRAAAVAAVAAWAVIVLAAPVGIAHGDGSKTFLDVLRYFALFFGMGVVFFLSRAWLPVSPLGVAASVLLLWATLGTRLDEPAMALALGYGLIWLSTFRFGSLRDITNDSDYSYAVFLWHMPVAQALLAFQPEFGPISLLAATLAITLVIAFLSWELIERPALALRHRFFAKLPAAEIDPAPHAVVVGDATIADVEPSSVRSSVPAVSPSRLAHVTQSRAPGRLQPGEPPPSIVSKLGGSETNVAATAVAPGRDIVLVAADDDCFGRGRAADRQLA